MGKELGTPCVTNVWIPDGYKDIPIDRLGPRQRLADSLDQIFAEKLEAVLVHKNEQLAKIYNRLPMEAERITEECYRANAWSPLLARGGRLAELLGVGPVGRR